MKVEAKMRDIGDKHGRKVQAGGRSVNMYKEEKGFTRMEGDVPKCCKCPGRASTTIHINKSCVQPSPCLLITYRVM